MMSRTKTRQSPKPTSKCEYGKPYKNRSVKMLISIAPQPIQHCCIMNGVEGSRVNSDSCSTAPREVNPTADARCTKPTNHSLAGGGEIVGELVALFAAAAAIMLRACCSSWQNITVAAATITTKMYCNFVWGFLRTRRDKTKVMTIENDLPSKLNVPTSKCCIDAKLSMSPAVNRPVVMQKRQSMSGRYNLLKPRRPNEAEVQMSPKQDAMAQAWNVSAATLK
mmetsp:Transcript_40482/g.106904  ORF Transcript_40482/g.106904 Transcript_40482/m.106904 type:complete len:223 (+) Transcript_40482:329-997(+)